MFVVYVFIYIKVRFQDIKTGKLQRKENTNTQHP